MGGKREYGDTGISPVPWPELFCEHPPAAQILNVVQDMAWGPKSLTRCVKCYHIWIFSKSTIFTRFSKDSDLEWL